MIGLLAALRQDPWAIVAAVGLLAGLVGGGAWALARPAAALTPVFALQLGAAAGAVVSLSLRPLTALRAGPFAELAVDHRAVFVWLWTRTLAGLALTMIPVTASALLMGWRPGPGALFVLVAAGPGAGLGAAIRTFWPATPLRLSSTRLLRFRPARHTGSRARRLWWIELSRRERGLPVGVSAAAAWLTALLIGMTGSEPRLTVAVDAASALLVFLATIQTLRFDAATVRLLAFEPNSLFELACDLFGPRLAAVIAAGALAALVTSPLALAGLALGVGLRALEFLHVVRRHAATGLLAQLEIGLVLLIVLVAGPAALAWIVARSAWLYRRAGQSMGLA